MAQSEEQETFITWFVGSIPTRPINNFPFFTAENYFFDIYANI